VIAIDAARSCRRHAATGTGAIGAPLPGSAVELGLSRIRVRQEGLLAGGQDARFGIEQINDRCRKAEGFCAPRPVG